MNPKLSLIFLPLVALAANPAPKPEKPVIYTHLDSPPSAGDLAIEKQYGARYAIVDYGQDEDFVRGRIISGESPRAKDAAGRDKRGLVLVSYIVKADGRAHEPFVSRSSDPSLNAAALDAVRNYRFTPSTKGGKTVDAAGTTPVIFHSDVVPPVEKPGPLLPRELEPLCGSILVPKNWFMHRYDNGKSGLRWIISKEDTEYGQSYMTGMSVQVFFGVKEMTGKSPEENTRTNYERFRKASSKVIRTWEPTAMGEFTRIGIETEDDKSHVIYSFFYCDEMDMVAATVVGAPKEQWAYYEPTFKRMADFKLMDMEAIRKAAEKPEPARPAAPAPAEAK